MLNPKIAIDLEDFEPRKHFIKLESNYKYSLLQAAIDKAGSQSKLAKIMQPIFQDLVIKQTVVSTWLHRKNLRLDILFWLCGYVARCLDTSKIIGLKGATTSKYIHSPKLPICVSKELATLAAHLYCDGTICTTNHYTATYFNTCKELLNEFKYCLKCCFGDVDIDEVTIAGVSRIRIPGFIGYLFYHKLGLNKHEIPTFVWKADDSVKAAYLRAVFDDEGTIHKQHGQTRLKMKHKPFIEDVKQLVEELSIDTSKVHMEIDKRFERKCYFFHINCQPNIKRFYEIIGTTHPEKLTRLKNRLRTYKHITYGLKAQNKILNTLDTQNSKNVKEIAEEVNRDPRTVQHHLSKLHKTNHADYLRFKKRFCYEYYWYATKIYSATGREANSGAEDSLCISR